MESYLLQSSIALAIFYLLYRIIIYREGNQQLKRFMGICIALFCSCFLLVSFPGVESPKDFPVAIQGAIESVTSIQSTLSFEPQKALSPWLIVYLIGAGIVALRFLIGLVSITRLYFKSEVSRKWGFILVESEKPISPFSFFSYLFITKGEIDKPDLAPIILHEKYHKDQLHSIDAVMLELLTILFWFNPFMWLLQRDIKASHEYLADDYVVTNKGFDKLAYQNLLFEARTGVSYNTANYLSNQTSLKQRFKMMEKRKTHSKTSFLRAGIVLAAMVTATFMTSFSSIPELLSGDKPNIKLFTATGEVDLEKGISKTTDKLYLRMMPKAGSDLSYRLSKSEATLVSKGRGLWTMRSDQVFDFGSKLSETEDKCALIIEVQEYMTKDENDQVDVVKLEKAVFINIPVY